MMSSMVPSVGCWRNYPVKQHSAHDGEAGELSKQTVASIRWGGGGIIPSSSGAYTVGWGGIIPSSISAYTVGWMGNYPVKHWCLYRGVAGELSRQAVVPIPWGGGVIIPPSSGAYKVGWQASVHLLKLPHPYKIINMNDLMNE